MNNPIEKTLDTSPSYIKTRQSNLELLRIVCMILIIAHHFSVHSTLPDNVSWFNKFIYNAFAIGGKVAVNVFVLISGFFMVKSKFKLRKLLLLIWQTLFYSSIIYFILILFGFYSFDINQMLSYILKFYTKYWFMTNFLILYALSPFLNKIICYSNRKSLFVLMICAIILQTQILSIDLGNLVWFCTLYIIAGYIRIYHNKFTDSVSFSLIVTILYFLIILFFYTLASVKLWDLKNIFCLIFSISLFCLFKNIKIKHNKVINFISSATLGVYLIHDNHLLRQILWNNWLNVNYHLQYNYFWLFALCSVLLVFVICFIIEILRSLLERLMVKFIYKEINKKKE